MCIRDRLKTAPPAIITDAARINQSEILARKGRFPHLADALGTISP